MLCFPNCKINLGLYVTRKREDGYHDIETVFYPVQFCDVLEVVPAASPEASANADSALHSSAPPKAEIHASGLPVAGDSANNLVWKAYSLLQAAFPARVPAMDIFLHKVIPMGAGLGGGSADGAFMLRLINDYCSLGLSNGQLASLALQLGSDCPFFIYNTPQFASGRGEQMEEMSIDLSGYSIQLICPGVHVSTAAAFAMIRPRPAAYDLRQLGQLPVSEWKAYISNDFEEPVFKQHPALAAIKEQLYGQGALYAAMSGSGSAIFAFFRKGAKAQITVDIPFTQHYIE